MPSAQNIVPLLALLVLWLWWIRSSSREGFARRHTGTILLVLASLALATHMNFGLGPRALPRHGWDFYHYYIGPKYFRELGHTGLYEAQTVADYEDDRAAYHPQVWVRVLEDYSLTHKALIIAKRDEIVARFSPERWQEFKADVAAFRHSDLDARRVPRWTQDHGYNGSPLTTVINRTLAEVLPLGVADFVRVVSWFDIVLVLGAAVAIGRALSPRWALLFVISFGLNPLNSYLTIGASYLRYVYFVALALAIVALLRGRNVTSGILFALSTHLRIFPFLLPVALFASDLLRPDRRASLRARRGFYATFAATGLLLVGLTSIVETPDGRNVWLSFFENSRLHSQLDAVNQAGLRYPFRYSESANRAVALQTAGAIDWGADTRRTFERHAVWFDASALAFLALCVPFLRRVRRDEQALFAGFVWIFALSHISSYDYVVLSLVPLLFRDDRWMWQLLALAWIAIGALNFLPEVRASIDWGFRAISWVLIAYFALGLAIGAFAPRREALAG